MVRLVYMVLLLPLSVMVAGAQDAPVPTPPEEQRVLERIRLAVPLSGEKAVAVWRDFAKAVAVRAGKPVTAKSVKNSEAGAKLLREGKVDFAVLEPEDYVRIADATELGATLAVLKTNGSYGFQAALLVRPESAYVEVTDVLHSEAVLGLLRMEGFVGRFYRGPITDERWRVHEEMRERLVYGKDSQVLARQLEKQTGRRKLDAVLLPVSDLPEVDADEMRGGLREIWLSPLCPGRVLVGRAGLGKLQRRRVAEFFLAAMEENDGLKAVGVGGFRLIDDRTFEPLREFLPLERR